MMQKCRLVLVSLFLALSLSADIATGDLVKAVIRNAFTTKQVNADASPCANKTACKANFTCCEISEKDHGCCDLVEAVCCSDKKHCCPKGYRCDLEHNKCIPALVEGPFVPTRTLKLQGKKNDFLNQNVICPDQVSFCPTNTTCCKVPTGQYGCCPLSEAVCCGDGIHCCPQGRTCNLSAGTCDSTIEMKSIKTIAVKQNIGAVKCDDGSSCFDGMTCCILKSGHYGCCPFINAICCKDKKHCCPPGYECSGPNSTNICHKPKYEMTITSINKVADKASSDHYCLDGASMCPNGTTCCMLADGQGWGCCPLENATCCDDGEPCCPVGYTCDALTSIVSNRAKRLSSVVCPGGQYQCPDGGTCCLLPSGVYGCCPSPQATCCSDGIHCCPHGYKCDVAAGTCTKAGAEIIKTLEKLSAKALSVLCPDGTSYCPDGNTCCKMSSGAYGCCPIPNAVCCSDRIHCCPNGYTCDVSAGTCMKQGENIVKALEKLPAIVSSVVCPGGQYQCPDGSTCCLLPSGVYGCCPSPQATCCSDGIHCCPHGYKCDVAAGTCTKAGAEIIKTLEKLSAKALSVLCPDGTSYCPDGNTCCKMSSGAYGCCPMPNAVCCSDRIHCCPNGYTCDVSAGTCMKQGENIVKALEKLPAIVSSVICPGGQYQCPDGSTCCLLPSGVYGCCPSPQATCCSDGIHCCPHGYKCDVAAGTCTKAGAELIKALEKLPVKALSVLCPDGTSYCPDENTCCKMSSGAYGCCPIPNAVCCSDRIHCCPNGYTCDVSAGTCMKQGENIVKALEKLPAIASDVVCPDPAFRCPAGSTCCKFAGEKAYGCCPIVHAVCCSDGLHCCPQGYTCDVVAGTCMKKGEVLMKALEKLPAVKVSSIVCPGGKYQCPDGSTCCLLPSGKYGCCPSPQATCCSDGIHCCPHGYKCDVAAGTCTKAGAEIIKALEKLPAKALSVLCPDGSSYCPDGNTCCKMSGGAYGCCPIPNAVCCSDRIHCCPNGYTCDVSAGTCMKQGENIVKALEKLPAIASHVVCPDPAFSCPAGSTCCKFAGEQAYGCCPIVHAVCCSDGLHCCPQGYTCDVAAGTCTKKGEVLMKALENVPAVKVPNPTCPDGTSSCPDGTTCCTLSGGGWGCCPFVDAVCCNDGLHCCPQGYKCDVTKASCYKQGEMTVKAVGMQEAQVNDSSVICPGARIKCRDENTCCQGKDGSWFCCPHSIAVCCDDGVHCCPAGTVCNRRDNTCDKITETNQILVSFILEATDVTCPDGASSCPTGNTCCKLGGDQGWGCCPLPKAVCCSDGVHCCPNGYTCGAGTCLKQGEIAMKAVEKLPAKDVNIVCPDGSHQCPAATTCCKRFGGGYGCCPHIDAVCCGDGIHCCPHGYTCSDGFCSQLGEITIKASVKLPAKALGNVICPGGTYSCPDGSTCCQLGSGQWGCCPLPDAVCCSDHVHCCPSGYTCDVSSGSCSKSDEAPMEMMSKLPAKPLRNVVCPGGSAYCSDGSMCCQLASGQWGCCPLPSAVCCSDHIHCCPTGYTCDVSSGSCSKSGEAPMEMMTKLPAKPLRNVVCPGGSAYCPDGSTCCQLASGQWGCCPLRSAVCCLDHIHCCPTGYTCDVSSGSCSKSGEAPMEMMTKLPAKPLRNVVCPGGSAYCPDGSTCCQLASGQWGCCPLPSAVCCSDHIHCCPTGYTCDVSSGSCSKSGGAPMEMMTKLPAKPLRNVVCPGGSAYCPDGSTCCQLASGQWGCCPLPSAVCCSDHIHCCPTGYTCDVSSGSCSKSGEASMKMMTKLAAKYSEILPLKPSKTSLDQIMQSFFRGDCGYDNNCVMCPDGSECADFNTCCQLSDGAYGCCGYPSAVCCADHLHCCKRGFVCDTKHNLCVQGGLQEPMTKMRMTGREYAAKSSQGLDEM